MVQDHYKVPGFIRFTIWGLALRIAHLLACTGNQVAFNSKTAWSVSPRFSASPTAEEALGKKVQSV